MANEYRVVTDAYNGFEVQYRKAWWPFWWQCGRSGGRGTNSFSTLEEAEKFAARHPKNQVVKNLGRLP